MGTAADDDMRDTLRAARDLSESACQLANLAARLAGSPELDEHASARQSALEASVRAARRVFSLEEHVAPSNAAEALGLAADTLALAEEAVRCAREAVEAALPATVSR